MRPNEKLYLVVRGDLPPGSQLAQSCHVMRQWSEEHPELDQEWFRASNYLAVLAAQDEKHLYDLVDKAHKNQVNIAVFREPDLGNQVTAVAFEPSSRSQKLLRDLPLALK